MEVHHEINEGQVTLEVIDRVLNPNCRLSISESSRKRIIKCREYIDQKISNTDDPIYGVTTGFGSLYNKSINKDELHTLQSNLIKSHAFGVGEEVQGEIVRLMLFLKIQSLSYGHSGIRIETVDRLIELFNNNILPVVYEQGSLGASGDLAPLAHLSLPLIGLGHVYYKGKVALVEDVYRELGWSALELEPKEGLALLNGTQFMSAYGLYVLSHSNRLSYLADLISAVSLDAYDGRIEPFDQLVHDVRAHKGQVETARSVKKILEGSDLISQEKKHVQDPYSFRCIPQIHGASKDVIRHTESVLLTEANSVTDNPTIFPDEDKVISAGNFHGQPLAMAMDYLAIALAELGNVSERRTYLLVSGQRGLPEFLVANPGLNSGMMIPQYTAASIVSQNKQLCTPSSVDSIPSSNGQEDHVSMGANSATKLLKVMNNLEKILAIELLNAAQAIEFRKPIKSSPTIEGFISSYRRKVTFLEEDRYMHRDLDASIEFVRNYRNEG